MGVIPVTESQADEFMALAKSTATNLRVEVRVVSYAIEAAGHRVVQALYFLAVIVAVSVVALVATTYGLKGGA
jgi:hypothetical protein